MTRRVHTLTGVSPNQPATKIRGIRIPDDLWEAVQKQAAEQGTTASDVVRDLLTAWVRTDATGGTARTR